MNYEEIRKSLGTKFDEITALLQDLQSKAREMKHETRAKRESQLAEIERQRREARSKVTDFSSDSAEAWATFKTGMENTWQALKKTCEDTAKKFE
jgi:DNA-binding transcriptional MerR regulator